MGALRRHVGAAVDGLRRQGLREAQVRAVRLVDEQQHIVRMDERCDARKVKGHAVVRRVDAGQRLGLRMRCNGPSNFLFRQAHRDAETLVDLWLQKDGLRAREDDTADHRAVRIARHEHRIAGAQRAHEHRVDCPRRAVDHEVRLVGAVERGRHLLRLLDAHRRLVQVVELFHQRDFLAKTFLRHERLQERMRAEPLLVARRVIGMASAIGARSILSLCCSMSFFPLSITYPPSLLKMCIKMWITTPKNVKLSTDCILIVIVFSVAARTGWPGRGPPRR